MEKLLLKNFKNKVVHFIGIGGISMSALAQILKKSGAIVQGSDASQNDEVKKLIKKKISVMIGHKKENIFGADFVVYSSAIKEDNEELQYAISSKIKIIKRAELLGIVAKDFKNVIAISGSHGKTTATAMLIETMIEAGLKPSYHVGGELCRTNSNFGIGRKEFFVTEACEYKDNFLYLTPTISVILNVDKDHLDYFGTIENIKKSFKKFAEQTKENGIIISNADDKNFNENIYPNLATFSIEGKADLVAKKIREYKPGLYSFDVYFCRCKLGNIKLNILGKHNVYNALVVVLISIILGIDFETVKFSLEHFLGTKRRCEFITENNGVLIYHDYAHHPKQIEKMIEVGKSLATKRDGKLFIVFEPHTYSRTKFLLNEFEKCFNGADGVIFLPAYSARENKNDGVEADDLCKQTSKCVSVCKFVTDYDDAKNEIEKLTKKNDVVLILGAGTIENLAHMLKK
ncbi:MAG: UDP-N-acetylmuramate--L-alanine ligase [Clostridia bacterium]|nr:UDP-N-acetylmuramate--L-alanine ligase [Clostridia bacterium]